MSEQPPAGWHTDPEDPSQYRYWNGQAWTDERAPKHSEPPGPAGAEGPTEPADKPWWKRGWVIGLAVLVLFVMVVNSGEDEGPDEAAAPPQAAEEGLPTEAAEDMEQQADEDSTELAEVEPEEVFTEQESRSVEDAPVLAITPDEFASRWDATAREFDTPELALNGIDVESGEAQDVFQVMLSSNISMLGSVLHSGELRDVLLMAQATTDSAENMRVLAAWGVLIGTLSPELDPDGRGEVLDELGVIDGSFAEDGHEASAVRGDVRYTLRFSEMIGWMMSGAPADS